MVATSSSVSTTRSEREDKKLLESIEAMRTSLESGDGALVRQTYIHLWIFNMLLGQCGNCVSSNYYFSFLTTQNVVVSTMKGSSIDVVVRVLMCHFHMVQAARNNVSKLKERSNWAEIKRDLDALHNVPHPYEDAFEYYLDLFYEKWRARDETAYVEYFRKEWGGVLHRWSRAHHPPGYASSNNGLESQNKIIKEMCGHTRSRVLEFLQKLVRIMKTYSKRAQYEDGKGIAKPSDRPKLDNSDWKGFTKYRGERKQTGYLEKAVGGKSEWLAAVSLCVWASMPCILLLTYSYAIRVLNHPYLQCIYLFPQLMFRPQYRLIGGKSRQLVSLETTQKKKIWCPSLLPFETRN